MGWTRRTLSRRWTTAGQVLALKQTSVNTKYTDLDDKLFSRTASDTVMETPTMQELTEQASVTNVKTETSTMQSLRTR